MRLAMAILSVVRFFRSRTSQNGVIGVGLVVAAIQWLRVQYPGVVLWSPEADVVIESAVIAVAGPYLGRLLAFLRSPDKLRRAGILALLLCVGLGGAQGCVSTQTLPDGTVVQSEVDWETLLVLLDRLERYQEARETAERSEDEESAARWQERIDQVLEAIERARAE